MAWQVEFTDEFEDWWNSLTEEEQVAIDAKVRLLEERGPNPPPAKKASKEVRDG